MMNVPSYKWIHDHAWVMYCGHLQDRAPKAYVCKECEKTSEGQTIINSDVLMVQEVQWKK